MRLCLITNQAYALPTIITATDIAHIGIFEVLSIVKYPDFKCKVFDDSLHSIASKLQQQIEVHALTNSPYKNFKQTFHFPDVVFVKLLLPSLFNDQLVLFLDSGVLITNRSAFVSWLQKLVHQFLKSNLGIGMPTKSWELNNRWAVKGVFIIYKPSIFKNLGIHDRLVSSFNKLITSDILKMPEQDLIDLTLGKDELFPIYDLPFISSDLTLFANLLNKNIIVSDDLKDYAIFKFVGSFKPWFLWVLNPDKQIFLKRVAEVSLFIGIPLTDYDPFYEFLPSTDRINLATSQSKLFSRFLSGKGVICANL